MIQVPTYYWVSTTPGANASAFAQWSLTPSGAPLGSWPGTSPDASDDFAFDHGSTANCNWDIAAVQSIQQSLVTAELYTGVITFATNVALKGLILNGEITDGGTGKALTFSGANLSALNDASSRKRYVLNGQKAKHGSGSTLLYKIQPATNDVHLDNGPYNKLTIDSQTMTLAYSVPTATTHDNADDGTIHIKGAFVAAANGGFARASAPNGALDTQVKIKFDTTSFTYPTAVLDFNMATAFFRGMEIPVTGSQTYGTSANGFTAKHYGLVVFAASNGEQATISNGLSLNCFSLEVKAGARLTCGSDSGKPVQINSQTQPIIKGVWSFQSSDGHTYISPRATYVAGVGSGGTGLSEVVPNGLLIGNASSAMSDLVVVSPGTNGHVLTLVAGVPTWAAASGGGGSGTVTSIATSAPITGGTITATGTIGISAATTSAAGSMSSADKTKLDGIETAADVTDTANVTAAGALMDSEVTNLAAVKSFDPAAFATAAQGALADTSLQDPAAFATAAQGVKADSAQQPPSEGPFVNGDKTKLDGIAAGATNTPALQHMRLFLKNLPGNAANYVVSGAYTVLDIANTTNWGESTTGAHPAITLVNDTNDHITLTKGGIYQIVFQVEFFPATSTQSRDMWAVISTDSSSTGQLGTDRLQSLNNGVGNLKLTHTVVYEIPNAGSDTDIFFSLRSNGQDSDIIAFNDNRSSITVTRLGDAIS